MQSIVDWWINYKSLSKEEARCLYTLITEEPNIKGSFESIENDLFCLMPASNLTPCTSSICFSDTATDFIKALFNEYVTDETLIISTPFEHENVRRELDNRKNKKILLPFHEGRYNINFIDLAKEIKKYKNVFVYIIGTQISTGEITPHQLLVDLKECLIKNSVDFKFVLDDVHGMFITPRDYSMFDYVLNTAHALIPRFNLGMLVVNNKNVSFGKREYSWANKYLKRLKITLDRKDKLFDFYKIIEFELQSYLNDPRFGLLNYITPNIFALRVEELRFTNNMKEKLNDLGIRIEDDNDKITFVRMRAQNYLNNPEHLIPAIDLLKKSLNILMAIEQCD